MAPKKEGLTPDVLRGPRKTKARSDETVWFMKMVCWYMWNELEEDKQLQLSQQEIDRKKGKFKHESKCGNQYIVNAQELKMYNVKYKQDKEH